MRQRKSDNKNCRIYINSRNNVDLKKGARIEVIESEIKKEMKKEMKKEIKVNADTQHRMDIHATINILIQRGYRKKALLSRMYEEFPDSNYKEYFSRWIDDKIEKNKTKSKNKNEREI